MRNVMTMIDDDTNKPLVMTIILQETDGVLLESYLIYEPEHQVIIS